MRSPRPRASSTAAATTRDLPRPAPPSMSDAYLEFPGSGLSLQAEKLGRGSGRTRCIVFVRERCAEHGVEIRAIVADRQLECVSAVRIQHALRTSDELVECLDGVVVGVVVDA